MLLDEEFQGLDNTFPVLLLNGDSAAVVSMHLLPWSLIVKDVATRVSLPTPLLPPALYVLVYPSHFRMVKIFCAGFFLILFVFLLIYSFFLHYSSH